jgi:polysaccharide biosynthesis transport protein
MENRELDKRTVPAPGAQQPAPGGHYPAYPSAPYPHYGRGYYYGDAPVDEGILGSLHPRRLMRVLRRKWKTVFAAVAFAMIVASFYLWTTPKIYMATCLIEMSQRRPRIMNQQSAVIEDQMYSPSEEIYNTRLKKFGSLAFKVFAVPHFKEKNPEFGLPDAEIVAALSGAKFSMISKSKLFQITGENSNPKLVAAVVNTLAEATELSIMDENRRASDSAVAWLQEQALSQQKKLADADQAVVNGRKANKLDVFENQKKALEASLTTINDRQAILESQAMTAQDMVNVLATMEIKPENTGKLPDTVPHSEEIKKAMESWNEAIGERDTLLIRYQPRHPEVIAKEKAIALFRARVLDAVRVAKETAQSNLGFLKAQVISMKTKTAEMTKQLDELGQKIVETGSLLTSLERERDACDVSYKGILNRIEEARLSADENTTTVKVIERASQPRFPAKPNPSQLFVLAFMIGLVGGMVLALLTDAIEDRIVNATDVEFGLGLRVIGVIPHADVGKRGELATASLSSKHGQVVEAFAGVRGILDSEQKKSGSSSVLVVTSTSPEEGKTITACNLGISFAKSGRRTVLVDMDLRKPRLGRIFSMPPDRASLIDVLWSRDDTNFPLLPFHSTCENLDIIASRPSDKLRPVDVVGDLFVRDFINWIGKNYDTVVIDTPPFGIVSDAAVLAGLAGGLVMVCRPDVSRKRSTRYAVHQFRELGVNLVGVVVNDVDLERNPILSNYDHHYSYKAYKKYYSPSAKDTG